MAFGFGFGFPRRVGPGGAVWSPSTLFASGEQGAWYDPSDLTTLWQDSAGTTAVTAVEQPVGLMLDKSKGLVLGSELVTNGWTLDAGWSQAGQVFTATNIAVNTGVRLAALGTAGRWYRVTITWSGITAAWRFYGDRFTTLLDFSLAANGASGSITGNWFSTGGTTELRGLSGSQSGTFTISVRELAGNHAFNPNATTVRPTLSARYNLLTQTEDFSQAVWVKTNVTTANSVGTSSNALPVARISSTSTNNFHRIQAQAGVTSSAGTKIQANIGIKADGCNFARIGILDSGGNGYVFINLVTGQVGTFLQSGNPITDVTVTAMAAGEWQVSASRILQAASAFFDIGLSKADNDSCFFNGSPSDSILIWGADLRVANESATIPYQRVVTATDYDADPTKFPYYLRFDGSDDWLQTASIDFSGTDKMSVFAGVRKLSDAAAGTVVELSATTASNNGTFALTAPSAAAANYTFTAGGTTRVDSTGSAFTAPTTDVLTSIADISGDSNLLRVDAYQAALNLSDQGTGNFGNYAMFIGRRNGASVPFSGRLYSLIIRGALTDAATIALAEDYVETKTFGKNMNIVYVDPVVITTGGEQVTIDGEDVYVTSRYE